MESSSRGFLQPKGSQRKTASVNARKRKDEDFNAQRLFEGQDKRVRGGYDEAISSLHN